MFENVALPVTECFLEGYNCTIFAYGQTAAGKTFTIQGPDTDQDDVEFESRGLMQRSFEYIFS
jgi:hypothetical protein